jgi:polyisoprenoid-binding protein YceI
MPLTLCHPAPAAPAGETFGGGRNLLKLHAAAAGHPFGAAGPDARPCPATAPLASNGGMQSESAVLGTTPQPGHYVIDPGGSRVTFRTRHLFGLGPVKGSFAVRGGTVDVADPLAASAIHAEIETASFRTNGGPRDRAVLSPRFLNPAGHPVMVFRSDRIDAGAQVLTGTLTVRGTTRPVTLAITRCGVSRGSFTVRATARVDRTEFGITAARGLAARYLALTLEVQCTRN